MAYLEKEIKDCREELREDDIDSEERKTICKEIREKKKEKKTAFEEWSELCNDEEERRKVVNNEWREAIDSDNENEKKPKHIEKKMQTKQIQLITVMIMSLVRNRFNQNGSCT